MILGGRLLQILKEFSTDPILSDYAIDTVWEDMKAMKDCKYIISMLLDDNPRSGLTEKDAGQLIQNKGRHFQKFRSREGQ
jgi:cohesin complex subunit SA-1/2